MESIDKQMYHTQENRGIRKLKKPLPCNRKDAWFGPAFYFWADECDAIRWGITSKNGKYDIYSARIRSDNVLDTVFNQEHYDFVWRAMEKVARKCIEETGEKPTKRYIFNYFSKVWSKKVDVLLACDFPCGKEELFPGFQFRERIQAAVYNENCIFDFKIV